MEIYFFCFSKTHPLTLQVLFAFNVTISMCLRSVAFKLQKQDEKTEDSSSASCEFCKSRKASDGCFFLGSLDRNLEQQRKKKATQTTALTYSDNQQKKGTKVGLGDCAHMSQATLAELRKQKNKTTFLQELCIIIPELSFFSEILYEKKKKSKMSLRYGQNFIQCCFRPPVQSC